MRAIVNDFDNFFRRATGIKGGPYPYQRKLATAAMLPELLKMPTALGKTAAAVLAWLWRRRFHPDEQVRALEPPPVHTEWSQPEEVTAVLYSLSGPVLPRLKAAAEVAEQVRRRLMGQHKRLMREDSSLVSPKFSGHDRAGNALTGHQHCFILPFAERQWGRIDRVLVWCNQPFDRYETLALHRLSELGWTEPKIHVVPVTAGPSDRLRPKSSVVESVTPFIPPRHYRRGRGDFFAWLASELRHECDNHGLPQPVSIKLVPKPRGATMWREFRRNRKGEPPRYGCGFRLEFPVPVAAPFSLGYGCHFGLGQFHAPAE